jgi:hypothetical protein
MVFISGKYLRITKPLCSKVNVNDFPVAGFVSNGNLLFVSGGKPLAPLRDGGARGMETGRFSRRHNKPTLKTAIWM